MPPPTPEPTALPTTEPSPEPTLQPTFIPTPLPTRATPFVMCSPFIARDTATTARNFATCSFTACGSTSVTVNGCPSPSTPQVRCQGDTYIRLFDDMGRQVASNDDGCGAGSDCSRIVWTPSAKYAQSYSQCQVFTVRQGCFGGARCSGTFQVLGLGVSRSGAATGNGNNAPVANTVSPSTSPALTWSCNACPANTFTTAGGRSCIACPASSTSFPGSSSCTCNVGTTPSGSGASLQCTANPRSDCNNIPNSFMAPSGMCLCNDGFSNIQPNIGGAGAGTATGVNPPTGMLTHAEALEIYAENRQRELQVTSQLITQCFSCPAGMYSYAGSPCIGCPDNSFASQNSATCTCNSGFSSSGSGISLICTAAAAPPSPAPTALVPAPVPSAPAYQYIEVRTFRNANCNPANNGDSGMISGTVNNRCISVSGGNELSTCSAASFMAGASPSLLIRTYASSDNTCSTAPMVSYNLNTACISGTRTSSTQQRCVSTTQPWANYGPGLLVTMSRSLNSCQGPATNADTWTFSPTGRCITGQDGGPYMISMCQNIGTGGFYTIRRFSTNDCSGAPTQTQNIALSGCAQSGAGQFTSTRCM